MTEINELRRTKAKLALLNSTEVPVNQLLFDLLDIVEDNFQFSEKQKISIIAKLDIQYRRKVQELTPKSKHKQSKLF